MACGLRRAIRDAAPRRRTTGDWRLPVSLPVSASSASTRSRPGKYITPSMTIGVAWELTFATPAAPRPRRAHCSGCETSRPERSRDVSEIDLAQRRIPGPGRIAAAVGQSASLRAVRGAWAPPDKERPAVSRATATNTRARISNGHVNVRAHRHPPTPEFRHRALTRSCTRRRPGSVSPAFQPIRVSDPS